MGGLEVDSDNTVKLTLWRGPLHRGMSTHELKQFAVDQYLRTMRDEIDCILEGLRGENPDIGKCCGRLAGVADSLTWKMLNQGGGYVGAEQEAKRVDSHWR